MGAASAFFRIQRSQVMPSYKTALTISGIVTAIALYRYFRILDSWDQAFIVLNGEIQGDR